LPGWGTAPATLYKIFGSKNEERKTKMAKKKQGWEIGLGRYAAPVKLNEGKGDDPSAKGKDVSKEVYENDDNPAVRGGRPRF